MKKYQRVTIVTFSMLLCTLFAVNIIAAGKEQPEKKSVIKSIVQKTEKYTKSRN